MRSNIYFRTLSNIQDADERKKQVKELEQLIKKYLENGGKITVIPAGATSLSLKDREE